MGVFVCVFLHVFLHAFEGVCVCVCVMVTLVLDDDHRLLMCSMILLYYNFLTTPTVQPCVCVWVHESVFRSFVIIISSMVSCSHSEGEKKYWIVRGSSSHPTGSILIM